MPNRDDEHPLSPVLSHTELQLQNALDEVCEDVAIEHTQTDDLIRIEETLAIASEAAKHAVSLRKRIETDQGGDAPPVS